MFFTLLKSQDLFSLNKADFYNFFQINKLMSFKEVKKDWGMVSL